jgi:hypothetical protein
MFLWVPLTVLSVTVLYMYVTVFYVPDAIGAEVRGVESSRDCLMFL